MANLDYNIMSGIRPIQLESPTNQLMQAYQLKGVQDASQMNALKMQEMQRGTEQKNRLRAAVSGLDIASPEANKLIEQAYLQEGDLPGLMAHRESMAKMNKELTGQQKATSDLFDAKVKQSRQFLEGLDPNSPTAVPDFIQWHKANHADPVLGPILAQRGVTLESSRARIEQAIKSGRIADLIDESKLGIEKFAELSPAYKKEKAEDFSRQYSEYVDTMARMGKQPVSQAEFRQYISQQRPTVAQQPAAGAQSVAQPGQGVALMSGETMAALPPPVAVAPVADGVTTTVVAAPQVEMVQTPTGPVPVSTRGAMPGMNATAAALYATGRAEDKQKADAIIAAEKEKNRPEALSPLGKLRQERAAAADKGDTAAVREYDKAIKKEINTAAQLAPVVPSVPSLSQNAIDDQANRFIIDGTLPALGMGKDAVANRNAIINRASELARAGGMSNDRITQMQNKANSAALSQLTKQETMVGAFEKNFVKNADLVLKFSSKVDRAGAPLLDKWIQSGKRAATGDPELKALDVAIKAVSNEYAKIVSGSMGNTAVAVSEIKRMESLLNSAMTKQDVLSVINVMKTETENRMAGFKEQKAELTNSMRGGAGAPPVGGVLNRKPLGELFK